MKILLKNALVILIIFICTFNGIYFKNVDNKFIVRLENYQHTQFYGPLYVGSTKQQMNFVFSTGSNDIWLFSSDCKNCNSDKLFKYDLSNSFMNYTQSYFLQVIFINMFQNKNFKKFLINYLVFDGKRFWSYCN